MRRALVFIACTGLLGCGSDDGGPTGTAEVEVLRYDYSFDVETRAATAELTLRFTQPGDCVTLPVRAGGIEAAYFDGEIMDSGELVDGQMTACGPGWDIDDETVLSVDLVVADQTTGGTQVGFSESVDIEGQPFYYMVSWIGGCDQFAPCDNAADRFAQYRFTVTHPSGYTVLCPGTLTPGDTETVCEFSYDGGPTYSTFGMAASPSWEVTDLGDWGGVTATLYDMPSTGIAAEFQVDQHRDFLAFMVDNFGPYPYGDELRFFTGPTYWSGFEHPGNISLNDRLNVQNSLFSDPLAHTTNHEMVHMWAGDQTTLASTYDFAWKESMANYLTYVFDDEQTGGVTALVSARAWKQFAAVAQFYPVPEDEPNLFDYYGDVYGAGPMVLFRQLEVLFSREQVMAALADLLGEQHAISVDDVKIALENATGADLTNYFDAWVYGEGTPVWPQYTVDVTPTGNGTEVTVTLTQANAATAGLFGSKFVVQLRGDNSATHDVEFDFGVDGAETLSVTTDPGFDPTVPPLFDAYGSTLASELRTTAAPPRARPAAGKNPWVAGDWR